MSGVLGERLRKISPFGSTYTLGVRGKDIDVIVLVDDLFDTVEHFEAAGFTPDLDDVGGYDAPQFLSLRQRDLNVIVTDDHTFYDGSVYAAEVCRHFKVPDRETRVEVHKLMRKIATPL